MEYRRNLLTREWVVYGPEIISPQDLVNLCESRKSNRDLFPENDTACPFCADNDKPVPPIKPVPPHLPDLNMEIFSVNEQSLSPGDFPRDTTRRTDNWHVRVIPARKPVFRIETPLDRHPKRLHDVMKAPGAHEKIILSPTHGEAIWDLTSRRLELCFKVLRHRMQNLARDPRLGHQYAYMVYGRNVGGLYNHSVLNLTASPFIPRKVRRELDGAYRWYKMKERCLLSDIYEEEIYKRDKGQAHGIVFESKNFIAMVPFFSGHPFETWILPLDHYSDFVQTPVNLLPELSRVLCRVMTALKQCLGPFPFIMSVMNRPNEAWGVNRGYWSTVNLDWLWRLRITPDLAMVNSPFKAFHSGTGARLNPVFPEDAAAFIRHAI